jgi:hypothetical protein
MGIAGHSFAREEWPLTLENSSLLTACTKPVDVVIAPILFTSQFSERRKGVSIGCFVLVVATVMAADRSRSMPASDALGPCLGVSFDFFC